MNSEKHIIPEKFKNIEQWRLSRRKMLKGLLALGVLSQIPLTFAFTTESGGKSSTVSPVFDAEQIALVRNIQQILLPDDGFGPGAVEIKSDKYLEWVMSDPRMDREDKAYIFNGLKWVNETANEDFKMDYLKLSHIQQKQLIRKISRTDWGESWLSVIMTYILEALLADPQYGGNPGRAGWEWLSQYPGYPRPTKDLLYPAIFDTLKRGNEKV